MEANPALRSAAPLVAGTVALMLSAKQPLNQSQAASALQHAVVLSPDLNHGRPRRIPGGFRVGKQQQFRLRFRYPASCFASNRHAVRAHSAARRSLQFTVDVGLFTRQANGRAGHRRYAAR